MGLMALGFYNVAGFENAPNFLSGAASSPSVQGEIVDSIYTSQLPLSQTIIFCEFDLRLVVARSLRVYPLLVSFE